MLHVMVLELARQKSALRTTALLAALIAAPAAFAQDGTTVPQPVATPHVTSRAKLEPSRIASYDNKFEVYGGLSFMNGQAGQNLPRRYNLGGGEGMVTYWIGDHLGIAGDYRWEGGTTPVLPAGAAYGYNRVKVTQNIFSGGVQWRGPKNRYVAIDYHALGGASKGVFDSAIKGFPGGSPLSAAQIGLYPNTTTPWGAAGGSLDFNYKANLAIRLQPEIIFEHFGTELREFFSISGGVVYRFGHR